MPPAFVPSKMPTAASYSQGKLSAHPRDPSAVTAHPKSKAPAYGLQPLGLTQSRDGLLYVPQSLAENGSRPAPLVVMMHGASGNAKGGMSYMVDLAEEAGVIIMSPQSRSTTWDGIRDGFGKDVELIDRGLLHIFQQHDIDPAKVAIGGFSDGASYALSLGLTNGQLFSHVIGFSPGFMAPGKREGEPALYITHGTDDSVLPIGRCSRQLIPQLHKLGYDVQYKEFEGPHVVQPSSAKDAMQWFLQEPLTKQGIPMKKDGNKVIVDVDVATAIS